MQNEKIATCKSATWNSAIHKKSATRKKCKMKRLLHRKVKHGNGAVWKKCKMNRVQHEKYKLPQWNMEKVHKNSAL